MGNPYWLDEDVPPRDSPRHDGRVDVAIVGAGITGCSAALRLAEAGLRVRVFDQRAVAEGASGRNGGFALRGGATRYDVARDTYGHGQALALWRWTEQALDRMNELGGDALARPGSYRLAADEEERQQIRAEYEALREDGIEAEWLDELPEPLAVRFHGAISHARDGSLQPARFVRRLAARAAAAGAEIREHERVDDVWSLEAEQVLTTGRTTPGRASTTGSSFPTGACCSAASATSRSSTSSPTSRRRRLGSSSRSSASSPS